MRYATINKLGQALAIALTVIGAVWIVLGSMAMAEGARLFGRRGAAGGVLMLLCCLTVAAHCWAIAALAWMHNRRYEDENVPVARRASEVRRQNRAAAALQRMK